MTNKVYICTPIDMPEGYELAEGKQPRTPKDNEPYLNSVGHVQRHVGADMGERIVLKVVEKEKPSKDLELVLKILKLMKELD